MPAYLIADVVEVRDPDLYEPYKPLVPPTLATFGGGYVARSGAVTILEGAWARPASWLCASFRWSRPSAGGSQRTTRNPSASVSWG